MTAAIILSNVFDRRVPLFGTDFGSFIIGFLCLFAAVWLAFYIWGRFKGA